MGVGLEERRMASLTSFNTIVDLAWEISSQPE